MVKELTEESWILLFILWYHQAIFTHETNITYLLIPFCAYNKIEILFLFITLSKHIFQHITLQYYPCLFINEFDYWHEWAPRIKSTWKSNSKSSQSPNALNNSNNLKTSKILMLDVVPPKYISHRINTTRACLLIARSFAGTPHPLVCSITLNIQATVFLTTFIEKSLDNKPHLNRLVSAYI